MKYVTMDIVDGVFVVTPKGSEDLIWTITETGEVRTVLGTLASQGGFDVVVDLRQVRVLSTEVFGVFQWVNPKFESHHRRMILCNLSGELKDHIWKLGLRFELAENVEEALARLRRAAAAAGA